MVRVRFAPSPTGYLHIGGVRTALFNFLYARSQAGKFLLRIEDTDRERSQKVFEDEILKSLEWLGLTWDEPVKRQSERLNVYRDLARELVSKGMAYEEKNEAGQTAVKFKMPSRKAVFYDLVHDAVEFDTSLFGDLVLIKSDGYPSYHWACVVDDHEMEITHVVRGDDHISNTPRQMMLFESMGWKAPKYAHLPLIMGGDGTPLSKRHGAVSLTSFREMGFVPEGLINYLALLGWGAAGNEEFFSLDQLIKKFSLKKINKANARFNQEKLEWVNGEHLKRMPEAEFVKRLQAFYPEQSLKRGNEAWEKLCLLYRTRIKTLKDLEVQASYCFSEPVYDETKRSEFFQGTETRKHLSAWVDRASAVKDFSKHEALETLTREAAEVSGIQAAALIHPLRYALTGVTVSPGLFELMSVLGKEVCLNRVGHFIK